jgi:hypothetical protein
MNEKLIKELTEFYKDKKVQILNEMKETEGEIKEIFNYLSNEPSFYSSPSSEIKLARLIILKEHHAKKQGELNAIEEIWEIISKILNIQIKEEINSNK